MTDESPPAAARDFRFRDALRDLVRAPGVATLVIAAALAVVIAPLVWYTLGVSHRMQAAPDGRAAFTLYQTWCGVAIFGGAMIARCAAALAASTMTEGIDRGSMTAAEAAARVLVHGVPALLAALLAAALIGLGLIGALVALYPLVAITFVAAPAAAAEQLGPGAAVRRSAALTQGARLRLALWTIAVLIAQLAPWAIARATLLAGKKPPVAPILRMQQVHGWIIVAAIVVTALVQVAVYRRLRDAAR